MFFENRLDKSIFCGIMNVTDIAVTGFIWNIRHHKPAFPALRPECCFLLSATGHRSTNPPTERGTDMFDQKTCATIEGIIGYTFRNKGLLTQAFTRASYRNEHKGNPDNEVLELIGDSVLALTVLSYFKRSYTEVNENGMTTSWSEGKLSALKSSVVGKKYLSYRMKQLDLQRYLRMSKGDLGTGIIREESVLEDLFESIAGAIYVDSEMNFYATSKVVCKMLNITEIMDNNQEMIHISYRNDLQEWSQDKKHFFGMPIYEEEALANGNFFVTVRLPNSDYFATAEDRNTKKACEAAARTLLAKLKAFQTQDLNEPIQKLPNYIGRLQEHAQARHVPLPVYVDAKDEYLPDHTHRFTVTCTYLGKTVNGIGSAKTAAKRNAAEEMMKLLKLI